MYVDLIYDFGHDVPRVGQLTAVNSVGDLATRPSSLYRQIIPGVYLV